MTITIELSIEAEARLDREAARRGIPLVEVIKQALEQLPSVEQKPLSETLSPQQFAAALDEFVNSHRADLPVLLLEDISRASIYGAGE